MLAALRAHIRQVEPRPDGYVLDLAPTDDAIAAAAAVIEVERRCCPFLRFTLVVEPENGPVRLALTGSPAVREFLAPWIEPPPGQTVIRRCDLALGKTNHRRRRRA